MFERINDDDLAQICEEEGFPSVGDSLAAGQTQEQATAYMIGVPAGEPDDESGPYFYDDPSGRWLRDYVEWLAATPRSEVKLA